MYCHARRALFLDLSASPLLIDLEHEARCRLFSVHILWHIEKVANMTSRLLRGSPNRQVSPVCISSTSVGIWFSLMLVILASIGPSSCFSSASGGLPWLLTSGNMSACSVRSKSSHCPPGGYLSSADPFHLQEVILSFSHHGPHFKDSPVYSLAEASFHPENSKSPCPVCLSSSRYLSQQCL